MSAKLQIASSSHSEEELSLILSDFTTVTLLHHKQLFGGYSGSSYLVEIQDGTKYVVKVCNGYTSQQTEFMCRTTYHLHKVGYDDCCFPIQKRKNGSDDGYQFVSLKEQNGVPAFLLTFVEGEQADKVLRESPNLAAEVLASIGGGLGRMHSASVGIGKDEAIRFGLRWYEADGGCCDVQDQIDGKILDQIMKSNARDDILPFYTKELAELKSEMKFSKDGTFGLGITHGDPFSDNVLVNPKTGELASFIDIEDVCVGPLLFDLACCAIGCCFKEVSGDDVLTGKYMQILDFDFLLALIKGYEEGRILSSVEKEHFVPYMRLTLLCNCSWRFVKFNGANAAENIPIEAKGSYLELKRRIDYLHDADVVREIECILNINK